MTLTEGQSAPDFRAPDQDGTTRTLGDYRGRWLLLYFYPKDETPGCTTEACAFRDAFAQLTECAVVLGVSADSPESHRRFRERHALPFDLLSDQDQYLIHAYGADGVLFPKRVSFLIDPQGMIAKVYPRVHPETHAADILQDLTRLVAA